MSEFDPKVIDAISNIVYSIGQLAICQGEIRIDEIKSILRYSDNAVVDFDNLFHYTELICIELTSKQISNRISLAFKEFAPNLIAPTYDFDCESIANKSNKIYSHVCTGFQCIKEYFMSCNLSLDEKKAICQDIYGRLNEYQNKLTAIKLDSTDITVLDITNDVLRIFDTAQYNFKHSLGLYNKEIQTIEIQPTNQPLIEPITPEPSQTTNSKPKLSLSQIALIYVYNGEQITRHNGNEVAAKYGHKSGDKLYQNYNRYNSKSNRMGSGTEKEDNYKINLLQSVVALVNTDKKQQVLDEIETLNSNREKNL